MGKVTDLTGKKFGKLKVIERGPDKVTSSGRRYVYWYCRCDCGKKTLIAASSLRRGLSQSCGCSTYVRSIDDKADRHRAAQRLWNRSKRRAKNHGWAHNLTIEQVEKFIEQPCHYCGREPHSKFQGENSRVIKYQGLDRKDSGKGYTMDNVVPCCWSCNRVKGNLSVDDFISWIKALASRL